MIHNGVLKNHVEVDSSSVLKYFINLLSFSLMRKFGEKNNMAECENSPFFSSHF